MLELTDNPLVVGVVLLVLGGAGTLLTVLVRTVLATARAVDEVKGILVSNDGQGGLRAEVAELKEVPTQIALLQLRIDQVENDLRVLRRHYEQDQRRDRGNVDRPRDAT